MMYVFYPHTIRFAFKKFFEIESRYDEVRMFGSLDYIDLVNGYSESSSIVNVEFNRKNHLTINSVKRRVLKSVKDDIRNGNVTLHTNFIIRNSISTMFDVGNDNRELYVNIPKYFTV